MSEYDEIKTENAIEFRKKGWTPAKVFTVHEEGKCQFCGVHLTKNEQSNFVHYPHETVCDKCMVKIGLVEEES